MTDTRELVERRKELERLGTREDGWFWLTLDRAKERFTGINWCRSDSFCECETCLYGKRLVLEIESLTARLAAAEKDAGRLDALQRFLDENVAHPRGRHFAPIYRIVEGCLLNVVNLRAAIDAARSEGEK